MSDTHAKCVLFQGGGEQPYDKLVLATGSSAMTPAIEGNASHKIRVVNNLTDYGQFITDAAACSPHYDHGGWLNWL